MGRAFDRELAAAAVAALIVWGLFAATVVNPVVVADEVLFLVTALAGPHLAQAQAQHAAVQGSGALLYPEVVWLLSRLGAPAEAAAKALNLAAFTAAAAALAACSRSLADGRRDRAVVLAVLFAPVGTYAALVMPECAYFALAAAAAAVLLAGREEPREAVPGLRSAPPRGPCWAWPRW